MHDVMSRIKAAKAAAASRLRSAFGNEEGAIDIGSIIVGVLLLAIVGGGIFLNIQGVVPWAKDKGVAQDLNAVVTAEQVYQAGSVDIYGKAVQSYGTLAELSTAPANLVPASLTSSTTFELDAATAGKYWAVATSGNGKWYGVTNSNTTPTVITTPGATETTAMSAWKTQSP